MVGGTGNTGYGRQYAVAPLQPVAPPSHLLLLVLGAWFKKHDEQLQYQRPTLCENQKCGPSEQNTHYFTSAQHPYYP